MPKRTETSKIKSKLKKSAKIEKNEKFYVYGIFQDDVCLYIGQTTDFERRKSEHIKDLMYNKHENKSLQKYYNNTPKVEIKILVEVPTSNTLLIFFLEGLINSILKPKANKIVMMQGRARIVLQRCDEELAKQLVETIVKYYKGEIKYDWNL